MILGCAILIYIIHLFALNSMITLVHIEKCKIIHSIFIRIIIEGGFCYMPLFFAGSYRYPVGTGPVGHWPNGPGPPPSGPTAVACLGFPAVATPKANCFCLSSRVQKMHWHCTRTSTCLSSRVLNNILALALALLLVTTKIKVKRVLFKCKRVIHCSTDAGLIVSS